MRYIIVLFVALLVSSCSKHNDRWYLSHPAALQEALEACPERAPRDLSCQQLNELGVVINQYAEQLQANPQAFGQKIIAMQSDISRLEQQMQSASSKALKESLSFKIASIQKKLDFYMATVRLLESPVG